MRKNEKRYVMLIVVCTLISINYQASELSANQIIPIHDPNLSMCIKNTIGASYGEVTLGELNSITSLDCEGDNIASIEGLQYATHLESLNLRGNNIHDITPLAQLNSLILIDLSDNQIADLSPLASYANEARIYASGQNIQVSDIYVDDASELKYQITDLHGSYHTVVFDEIKPGKNNINIKWNFSTTQPFSFFSGTINQTVYYQQESEITGDELHEINEGKRYNDQQLIELYNVKSSTNDLIEVDDSQVDYMSPGIYPLKFTDQNGGSLEAELEVIDVLPKIESMVQEIYVALNSEIDFVSAFGVTAYELESNDLNQEIEVDAKEVNLNKVGTYKVYFSVKDDDGNLVSIPMTVNVFKNNFTIDNESSEKAKVYIQKTDEEGKGLPGYEYTIYDEDGNVVDVITTDENGYGESKALKNGNYTIVLTMNPNEHNKPAESKEDTKSDVEDESMGIIKSSDDKMEQVKSAPVKQEKSQNPVASAPVGKSENQTNIKPQASARASNVGNVNISDDLEVLSVTSDTESVEVQDHSNSRQTFQFEVVVENGSSPAGITFNVIDENGFIIQTIVSDKNGIITIDSLPVGEYRLVLAPQNDQYTLDNEVNIVIDAENIVSGMPTQITLKVEHVNYVAVISVVMIGVFSLVKLLPKFL